MRLTIKIAKMIKMRMSTIFGITRENNVRNATIPPAAVIGTPVKYFKDVEVAVTLNRAKRYAPNSGNSPAMYNPATPYCEKEV